MSTVPEVVVSKDQNGNQARHDVVMSNTGPHTVMLGTLHCLLEKAVSFKASPVSDLPMFVRPQTFKMAKNAMAIEHGKVETFRKGGAGFVFLTSNNLTEQGMKLTKSAKSNAKMEDCGCLLRVTITPSSSFSLWYDQFEYKVLLVIIVSDSFMISPVVNTKLGETVAPSRTFSTDGISTLSEKLWLYFLTSVFSAVDFAAFARENAPDAKGPAVYGSALGDRCGDCAPCKNRALHKPCERRVEREKILRRENLPGYKPPPVTPTGKNETMKKTGKSDIKNKHRAAKRRATRERPFAFGNGKRQAPVLIDDDHDEGEEDDTSEPESKKAKTST